MTKQLVMVMVILAGVLTAREALAQPVSLTIQKQGQGTVTSTPAGIDCGSACQKSFSRNERIRLTATPASGFVFGSWSSPSQAQSGNPCSASVATCEFTLAGPMQLRAYFLKSSKLTVQMEGADGTVNGPGGLTCSAPPANTTCAKDVMESVPGAPGTAGLVTLTAVPAVGAQFERWQGVNCQGPDTTPTCRFPMPAQDLLVRAKFATGGSGATLSIQKQGQGTVTSTPAGIDCGGTCQKSFGHNERVQVTATPAPGWAFVSWTSQAQQQAGGNPCSGSPATCEVTLTGALALRAHFLKSSKLTVRVEGPAGTVNGPDGFTCSAPPENTTCAKDVLESTPGAGGPSAQGSQVTLTAVPAVGAQFLGWQGVNCQGPETQPTCRFPMPAQDLLVRAKFGSGGSGVTLSIQKTGEGTVTSTPAGIDCGGTCQKSFGHNERVQVTATPAPGSMFVAWTSQAQQQQPGNPCAGSGATCEVTLTGALSLRAHFLKSSKLTVRVEGGNGTVNGPDGFTCSAPPENTTCAKDVLESTPGAQGPSAQGSQVTLTAVPAVGARFVRWVGVNCQGSETVPTCRFPMPKQDIVVRAQFAPGQ